ncbi:hypothetical protein CTAYLR_003051 [Chrysophaeum taylorii]|uniref:STI1/HOP DP domain-containing protein n=1 Tax=Chrysophaeum taylorii TaxID=2483200 RepID=A0AAD7U5G7_9STRA|nr:hypothetical protein CTAYLR_003051 [Chrysophaeum taylorii]
MRWLMLVAAAVPEFRRAMTRLRAAEDLEDADAMRIAEIKAELDLRGVSYAGIFEGSELRKALKEARLTGKADGKILNEFNRQRAEVMADPALKVELDDSDKLSAVTGADGTVPGGLRPDELQKLMQNPEIMALLAKPEFQKIMKEAMEGGPESIAKYMDDPETRDLLQTASKLVQGAGLAPPPPG